MTQLNNIQINRMSRHYAEIKGKHDQLISKLPSFDWASFGANIKAEGEAIVINCMGHRWEATPRFVSHGDVALMEYAFYEKVRDEYLPVARMFLNNHGLYKKSTCLDDDWVSSNDDEQIISEILQQAAATDVFKPIV